ncbi:hypothetical protein AUK11_00205 [bacterium CG2_30_37_16]|nr:MAG: hypothetical protein AUK11_00205 [bacterium CG2_30_37_16]PIP30643.1 MAG: hypothetical protein COX25_03570 [bacterium (Candidatus Howlettbacteria) CG23_combo_of_CG06-09_8_20_14_all_37_9]PIX98989.1 MAG: hypothetical protein COZ22_03655 [bacterium (Candidatus Howlettbacteria) CG_4_10_14_3_um_filter_37_10]PJB05387.1 MAG: hypothetical protein CO123_04195 [bacterium (Candidatus Howlettbacteria) CG_4_9_14_3_um_filter_37_10]
MLDINLIPTDYKKQIMFARDNRQKVKMLNLSLLLLALSIGLYLAGNNYFDIKIVEKTIEVAKIDPAINKLKPIEKKYKTLNSRVEVLKTIVKSHLYWTEIRDEVISVLPEYTTVQGLTLNSDPKKEQQITGQSKDLETVAKYRNNLENLPAIKDVKINSGKLSGDQDTTGVMGDQIYDYKLSFTLDSAAFKSTNGEKK